MNKTGKDALKRRVGEFDVAQLKVDLAACAKRNLKNYDLDDVRAVSNGAATFFVWVSSYPQLLFIVTVLIFITD